MAQRPPSPPIQSLTSYGPLASFVVVAQAGHIAMAGTGNECSDIERGIIAGGYSLAVLYVVAHSLMTPDPFTAYLPVKRLRVWIRLASIIGQLIVGFCLIIMQNGTKCFILIPPRAQSLLQAIGLSAGALFLIGAWKLLLFIFNKYKLRQLEEERANRRKTGAWVASRAIILLKQENDQKVVFDVVQHWLQTVPIDDKVHSVLSECNWSHENKKFSQPFETDKLSKCCEQLLKFQTTIDSDSHVSVEDLEDPQMLNAPNPLNDIQPFCDRRNPP